MIRHFAILMIAATLAACAVAVRAQGPPGEVLAPEMNPAVRAALELPRTKPEHYLSAVFALVDLQRPELAAPILQELIGQNLSDEQRAALVREFGSHRMLQLARTTALGPAGAEFAEACMAAAEKRATDPQRIAGLVEQLTAPSPDVRQMARHALAAAGDQGVVATIEAFAHEQDPQRREVFMEAIAQMSPAAVGPLLGMLASANGPLKLEVIRLLEAMHVTQAAPVIAATMHAPNAEQQLLAALQRYRRGTPAFVADADDEVAMWHWDDKSQSLSVHAYPGDDAQTIWMARLAIELAVLRPDIRAYQVQSLTYAFDAAMLANASLAAAVGTNDPAEAEVRRLAGAADGVLLSDVLAEAMKLNRPRSAIVAAKLIGEKADANVLDYCSPLEAPLAAALEFPDRRVRFAALESIMKLNPPLPFPGDSRVPAALGYFATGANERRAVVATPVAGMATTFAGRLAAMNIAAEPATRGAAAVRLAQQDADLEFILVDVDIDGPGIRDVLYALRTNAATGRIPIGLTATSERLDAAQRLAEEHTRVVAFPRPQSDAAIAALAERLTEVSDRNPITAEERAAMARQAVEWLGQLLARDTFYDLHQQAPVLQAALYLPEMSSDSIAALALIGTPSSQRALVDFASERSMPIEARQQAAAAFARSVAASGLLLTEEEMLRQYNRYNASESADAATQKVLGDILDLIESLRNAQNPPTGFGEGEVPAEPSPAALESPSYREPETGFGDEELPAVEHSTPTF
jgi:CheY-like chemotaxis protein